LVTDATITVNPIPPFDFKLSATVFSDGDPQIRKYEKGKFWQVIRVNTKLFLTTITTRGTVDEPRLRVKLESDQKISDSDEEKTEEIVCTLFQS
jgi:DNA-3-methyladenine glycosylase II